MAGNERSERASIPPPTRDTRSFAQQRAKDTYDALLQAAKTVFAEKGFDDAQTPDIARAAGVSVGTFYRYFTDKRHAFMEMIRQHLEESYQHVMQNLTLDNFGATRTPTDRRAAVEQVIDVLFMSLAEEPDLQRTFLALAMRDPDVLSIRQEFDERGRQALAGLISQVVAPEVIPDPDAAAEVIQITAQEVALATVGRHAGEMAGVRAVALRKALAQMIYRYVFATES